MKDKTEFNIKLMETKSDYGKGINEGIRHMKERIKQAAESGKPIEIDGRAYFVKTDLDHLKEVMDSMD